MTPEDKLKSAAASLRTGARPVSVASYIESDILRKLDAQKRVPMDLPKVRQIVRNLREGMSLPREAADQLDAIATSTHDAVDPALAAEFHKAMAAAAQPAKRVKGPPDGQREPGQG